jgi:signal transduction histidine kinase
MNNKKSSKIIQLTKINIPLSNLIHLIELQEEVSSVARHDLGNSTTAIRANLQLLRNYFEDEIPKKLTTKDLDELLKHTNNFIDRMEKLAEQSLSKMSILFPRSSERSQILISKPSQILQEIRFMWQEAEITLDKKSSQTLEIIYPENVLGIIINELITNSIKHSQGSKCKIAVSWHIYDATFNCEIHDNGIGILPNLSDTKITAGTILDSLTYEDVKPNGLSIINKLILKSGGNLFYSKSKRLGGTLAYFSFPIFAYYQKGHIYESK